MREYLRNHIDGAWRDGGAGRIDLINPAPARGRPNTRWPMRLM